MSTPSLTDLLNAFSPDGRAAIAKIIADAKERRGAAWIDEIKATYPLFAWLINLVANNDAPAAVAAVCKRYPFAALVKGQLADMHAWLRTEIDRPRPELARPE